MSESVTEKIFHRILMLLAIIVVFIALVFTLTRALTPVFNLHRDVFERWASQAINLPLKVKKISFGWRGVEPELWLHNVTVYSKDRNVQLLHLKDLYVSLNLFKSLMRRQVSPSLVVLSGANVLIKQHGNAYTINDLSVNMDVRKSSGFEFNKFKAWLLAQSNIELENININFIRDNHKSYPARLFRLSLLNNDGYHNLSGLIHIKQPRAPLVLNFVVHMKGGSNDFDHATISGYADFDHINLGDWLLGRDLAGYQIAGGYSHLQLWSHWQNGHLGLTQANVSVFDLLLHSKKLAMPYLIKHFSANAAWQPFGKGWQFSADNINVITPNEIWPTTQLLVKHFHEHHQWYWQLGLGYAQIADLRQLLLGSNEIPNKYSAALSKFPVSGTIDQLAILKRGGFKTAAGLQLSAQLDHLSMPKTGKMPGFSDVSLLVQSSGRSGSATIQPAPITFDFGSLFRLPLVFNQVKGDFHWQKQADQSWAFTGEHLSAVNKDLGLNGQASVYVGGPYKKPFISLLAGFHASSPVAVSKYLPVAIIHQHTLDWLDHAFIAGGPAGGKIILRGNLSDFPFKHKQGVFQVTSRFNDLHLHYAKGWPDLTHLYGSVLFSDNSMKAHIDSGQVFNAKFSKGVVEIPKLKDRAGDTLTVKGVLTDDSSDLKKFIEQSPLQKTVGRGIENIDMSGPAGLLLKLSIPFRHLKSTQVDGVLRLYHNRFEFPNWYFNADDVNGKFHFTQDGADAENITATVFEQPASVNISTTPGLHHDNRLNIAFNSRVDVAVLKRHFDWLNKVKVAGKTKLNGVMHVYLGGKNRAKQNDLSIDTDLQGISLDYPYPFGKAASMQLPSSAKLVFGLGQSTKAFFDVHGRIHSAVLFTVDADDKAKFYSALLRFGGGLAPIQTKPGIILDGFLPQFKWSDWLTSIQPFVSGHSKTYNASLQLKIAKLLHYVDLHFKDVSAYGVDMGPAQLKLSTQAERWFIAINSGSIRGFVSMPFDFPKTYQLSGNFQHIVIPNFKLFKFKQASKQEPTLFDPHVLPALDISANDLQYGDKDFGGVVLRTEPVAHGLDIKTLMIHSLPITLNLTGQWLLNGDKQYYSQVSGVANSQDLKTLMRYWEIKSSLIADSGNVQFNVHWPDTLYKPNVKQLVGKVGFNLSDGWITHLSKSTTQKLDLGRVLNLLSLRHLFRFNDLSGSGYSFDTMSGILKFDAGKITTDNLTAKGAVADLNAKGRVNLIDQQINMKLAVAVNVTSSLPVVATVVSGFNPIVGIATWLGTKIFHKAINNTPYYGYEIVGSFKHPVVKRLETSR